MTAQTNRSVYSWMRLLHRDIGFFVVGLTVIYCISGIVLTYRDTGLLRHEVQNEKKLQPGLTENQLMRTLKLKRVKIEDVGDSEIRFTNGTYNQKTGVASYISEEHYDVVNALNQLHKAPTQDPRHWFTLLYGVSLLFLSLSSFWMYKPGSKYFKRGVALAACGGVASVVLVVV